MIIFATHASFLRFILSHTDGSHDPQHSYRAKMKSGILLLKMRSGIFLLLEIILQTVVLGKLVFKFLSNISFIKLTGLLCLLLS